MDEQKITPGGQQADQERRDEDTDSTVGSEGTASEVGRKVIRKMPERRISGRLTDTIRDPQSMRMEQQSRRRARRTMEIPDLRAGEKLRDEECPTGDPLLQQQNVPVENAPVAEDVQQNQTVFTPRRSMKSESADRQNNAVSDKTERSSRLHQNAGQSDTLLRNTERTNNVPGNAERNNRAGRNAERVNNVQRNAEQSNRISQAGRKNSTAGNSGMPQSVEQNSAGRRNAQYNNAVLQNAAVQQPLTPQHQQMKRRREQENEAKMKVLWGVLGILTVLLVIALIYEIVLGHGTKQTGAERMAEQENIIEIYNITDETESGQTGEGQSEENSTEENSTEENLTEADQTEAGRQPEAGGSGEGQAEAE